MTTSPHAASSRNNNAPGQTHFLYDHGNRTNAKTPFGYVTCFDVSLSDTRCWVLDEWSTLYHSDNATCRFYVGTDKSFVHTTLGPAKSCQHSILKFTEVAKVCLPVGSHLLWMRGRIDCLFWNIAYLQQPNISISHSFFVRPFCAGSDWCQSQQIRTFLSHYSWNYQRGFISIKI